MTEQELIQENEKLNARLKKAIDVFKEQKDNITRLTEERDSAKKEVAKLETRVQELETKAAESSENDSKFFDMLNEIDEINGKVKQLETDKSMLNDSLNHAEIKNDELAKANTNLTKQLKQAQEEIEGLNADYDAEHAKVEELEEQENDHKETIENLTNALDKVNTELQEERKNTKLALNSISDLTEKKTQEFLLSIKELCGTNCPV